MEDPATHFAMLHSRLLDIFRPPESEEDAELGNYVRNYAAIFRQSIPKTDVKATLCQIQESIAHHKILLFGDFHSITNSQHRFAQLVSEIRSSTVIGLEAFEPEDQFVLQGYLEGYVSEARLLKLTQYRRKWGFDFSGLREIFKIARQRRAKVFGINRPRDGNMSMRARDRAIAENIRSLVVRFPQANIACLVGEYHLADSHLPFVLSHEKGLHPTRVLCNTEELFFNAHPTHLDAPETYLELGKNYFGILSYPPWIKWLMHKISCERVAPRYEEIKNSKFLSLWSDSDHYFYFIAKELSHYLGVRPSGRDLSNFHLRYHPKPYANRYDVDSKQVLLSEPWQESLLQGLGQFVWAAIHPSKKNPQEMVRWGKRTEKILNPFCPDYKMQRWFVSLFVKPSNSSSQRAA